MQEHKNPNIKNKLKTMSWYLSHILLFGKRENGRLVMTSVWKLMTRKGGFISLEMYHSFLCLLLQLITLNFSINHFWFPTLLHSVWNKGQKFWEGQWSSAFHSSGTSYANKARKPPFYTNIHTGSGICFYYIYFYSLCPVTHQGNLKLLPIALFSSY